MKSSFAGIPQGAGLFHGVKIMPEPSPENYPVDDRPSTYQPFPDELPPEMPPAESQNDLLENPPDEGEEEEDEAIY